MSVFLVVMCVALFLFITFVALYLGYVYTPRWRAQTKHWFPFSEKNAADVNFSVFLVFMFLLLWPILTGQLQGFGLLFHVLTCYLVGMWYGKYWRLVTISRPQNV